MNTRELSELSISSAKTVFAQNLLQGIVAGILETTDTRDSFNLEVLMHAYVKPLRSGEEFRCW